MISVIVSIYKVEKYLNECIESVVGQTYRELEIILVDDGSPDGCPTICDEWARKDDRIRVIHQENRGLSGARNAGLDVCKGDYILFLDGDDYLLANAIEILVNTQRETCADMVISSHKRIRENKSDKDIFFPYEERVCEINEKEFWALTTINMSAIVAWGKLYASHIWKDLRFPLGKINEDLGVICEVASKCNKIVCVNETTTCYRIIQGSIMRSKMQLCHLDEVEFRLKCVGCLMGKQFYDIALYYWGEGTRRLIEGYERLNDSDAKRRINELYQEYKEAAKTLCKVTKSFSKRAQLRLFGTSLRLYSGLKKLIKH